MKPMMVGSFFDLLKKSQKVYGKQLEPVCRKWELTRNEADVILFLYNNPDFDRATDIVTHRGMAKSHASLSVTNLTERGFLQRQFSETDRRTAHLLLTQQGRIIAEEAKVAQDQFFSSLYVDIPPEELELLHKTIRKVMENIDCLDKTVTTT